MRREHSMGIVSALCWGALRGMLAASASLPWWSHHITVQGKTGLALGKRVNGPTQAYASLIVNCRNFIINTR